MLASSSYREQAIAAGVSSKLEQPTPVVKPMLWQLLNTVDGSKHLLLGTVHRMNISLHDFPLAVQMAVEDADTLIGELLPREPEADSLNSTHNKPFPEFNQPTISYWQGQSDGHDLAAQLGEKHWRELQGLRYQKIHDVMAAIIAISRHEAYEDMANSAYPTLDEEIAARALVTGKQLVGLETRTELTQHMQQHREATIKHLQSLDLTGDILLENLKNIIDSGGINRVRDLFLRARTAYLEGNVIRTLKLLSHSSFDPYFDDIILDQRNRAWIESGKIQSLCWQGNRCFIYVGFAHLFKSKHPLIVLLREAGFEVTRISPEDIDLPASSSDLNSSPTDIKLRPPKPPSPRNQ